MPIAITPLDGAVRRWDDVVRDSADSSFCHLSAWRDILSDVLGAECLYQVATGDDGSWQGILPLVRVRSRIFGHYLVSVPFLNDGGPLGSVLARQQLVATAVSEARRSSADLLELRTRHDVELDLPTSSRKITVLLPLESDPQAVFAKFPAKLRSQIRRPMKEGLVVRFGPAHVEAFYEVFARTMRDLGTPVLPRAFFERVARAFPELAVFGVVYRGDQPLAGGCGFLWRDEFEITWAGALRESRSISANMLLYWALMEHVIGRGARVFNFGRCTPGGGTHRFKKQWGGSDVALPWRQFVAPEAARQAPPSPDDRAFSWGPRLWRRLPLPVANLVGPRLVRFLP
ncbi:MAG TPA: FemAB family XrtA/PEP-CTERM system-associated protein [Gemmatimonadales bacterium]